MAAGETTYLVFFLMLALMVSLAIIPAMIRLAPRFGMVDLPDARKVHARPIARVGGVGIVTGAIVAAVLALPMSNLLMSYVFGALVLFTTGLIDDRNDIGHYPKFLSQFLAVAVVIFIGDIWVRRVPLLGAELPPEIGIPFTFVAMVGVINALNHSDGLDGLAGGESLLSLIGFGLIALWAQDELSLGIVLTAIGGLLGFMRYNNHPARVFMGDSGSQYLGFTIAFIAVLLTQHTNTAVSAAVPALLIGLPVIDILSVFYLRISGGMHWFKASRNHIHHRLLDLGFVHAESVVIIYAVQAAMVTTGLALRYERDLLILGIYLGAAVVVFTALTLAERRGWRARDDGRRGMFRMSIFAGRVLSERFAGVAVLILVPVYFLVHGLTVHANEPWIGLFALSVGTVLLLSVFWSRVSRNLVSWLAAYGGVILLAYVDYAQGQGWRIVELAYFAALAAAIMLAVKTTSEETFRTTPLDYLIVMVMFGLLVLHRQLSLDEVMASTIVKSLVLLYGIEFLMNSKGQVQRVSRAVIGTTMGVMALRIML